MTPEQRQLIAEKQADLLQKWLAAQYLAALGPEVRSTLAQARLIVRPACNPIIAYRQFDERGLGREHVALPAGYAYARYDDVEELYAAVRAFGDMADGAVGYFCPTYLDSAREHCGRLVSAEPPVFEVPFGWARTHFPTLHAAARQGCNLTTRSGEVGILSRVTCGWHDRHADDRVHELARWGV